MPTTHLDQLKTDRAHTAQLANKYAVGALTENDPTRQAAILTELRNLNHQVRTLDQQIAWVQRHTNWVTPSEPAWSN